MLQGLTEKITGEHPKLFTEVLKLVQNMPDGVGGLLKQFQDKGLGQVVASWTGKGPKQAVTPDQILQILGNDKVNALASSSGLDPKVVPEKLAKLLPNVVEELTPIEALAGLP
jgi:uncharacterized protein YidB (DUF937 family)